MRERGERGKLSDDSPLGKLVEFSKSISEVWEKGEKGERGERREVRGERRERGERGLVVWVERDF